MIDLIQSAWESGTAGHTRKHVIKGLGVYENPAPWWLVWIFKEKTVTSVCSVGPMFPEG